MNLGAAITESYERDEGPRMPPHHFVTFVELFFAIVLGASILEFNDLLFPPDFANPSFWAIVAVYFTAVTSWIAWHKSTILHPYTDSGAGYLRSILDGLIVVTYAALLFFGSQVVRSFDFPRGDNSLCWYLWGFAAVFFLYFFSGIVRRMEYPFRKPAKVSRGYLISRHGYVILAGAVAYTVMFQIFPKVLLQLPEAVLWVFLSLPLITVLSFRIQREWLELPFRRRITIAVDMDGVLVEQVTPVLQKLKKVMDLDIQKCDVTHWEYPFKGTDIKSEIEKAEREEEFVRQMPPMENAVEAIQSLSLKFDIVIATSRESITDSWSLDWLEKHGIPFRRLANTRQQGKALPDVGLLIDDYIGNIEQFIRDGPPGRRAILFAQPWNKDTRMINDLIVSERVTIADGWGTVLAILESGFSGTQAVIDHEPTQECPQEHLYRDYLGLQAVACFLITFLFLRGWNLSTGTATSGLRFPSSGIYKALITLFGVLSFFYLMVALLASFRNNMRAISVLADRLIHAAERINKVMWFSIGIGTVAGIMTNWLDSFGLFPSGSYWNRAFLWGGLIFIAVYSLLFILSCFQTRRNTKRKSDKSPSS